LLMENANLTKSQDLGAVTELLSGDYFVPFGRSTSHQLWSSAMVITPTLRGLFGIDIDAQTKTITVNPHLPATWTRATIKHLNLPDGQTDISFSKRGDHLQVEMEGPVPKGWKISNDIQNVSETSDVTTLSTVDIPLPPLEVDQILASEIEWITTDKPVPNQGPKIPTPGNVTGLPRIIRQDSSAHETILTIEGLSNSVGVVSLVRNAMIAPRPRFQGAIQGGISFTESALHDPTQPMLLSFHFPPGEGWKTITVTLTW
ncbi:MAG TPA: hypothetical protein VL135_05355, partial [Terracidiphilus sp.]|nr:hypothetical protein [Terracidiphilus sp.]